EVDEWERMKRVLYDEAPDDNVAHNLVKIMNELDRRCPPRKDG
ncbi:unnamed protein product, partial [marine sediment metagenome]